jgi:hypothetical protein
VNSRRRVIAYLRPATLQLLACALLGAAALAAGLKFLAQESRSNRQAQAELKDVRSRLLRIDNETADLHGNVERYRQIAATGLLGSERRLEWVECIARIKAARRLFEMRYEFSPQKPLDASHDGFMASTMKLHMELLHEDDLVGFLDDLTRAAPALLHVRACSMERLAPGREAGNGAAQLGAECTIDWITLKEPA